EQVNIREGGSAGGSGEDAAAVGDFHRRTPVAGGDSEHHLLFGNDGVDVEDIAGDKLLQQVEGLQVAEQLEGGPQFVRLVNLLDPDGAGHGAGLEHPGRGRVFHEAPQLVVIEHGYEVRDLDAFLAGLPAHGELVAEMAHGGLAHPGQAQMLAQGGSQFDVEIVERHDAVDDASARQIAHRLDDVLTVPSMVLVGHVKDLVDALHGPFSLSLETQ